MVGSGADGRCASVMWDRRSLYRNVDRWLAGFLAHVVHRLPSLLGASTLGARHLVDLGRLGARKVLTVRGLLSLAGHIARGQQGERAGEQTVGARSWGVIHCLLSQEMNNASATAIS